MHTHINNQIRKIFILKQHTKTFENQLKTDTDSNVVVQYTEQWPIDATQQYCTNNRQRGDKYYPNVLMNTKDKCPLPEKLHK